MQDEPQSTSGTPQEAEKPRQLGLADVFLAPNRVVDRVELVEGTELEISAAIVYLKMRHVRFGGVPAEVAAYPFRPEYGWRQAALSWIRKNRIQTEKGNGTIL